MDFDDNFAKEVRERDLKLMLLFNKQRLKNAEFGFRATLVAAAIYFIFVVGFVVSELLKS